MSLSRPASTCSAMPPPPHDWNRSGRCRPGARSASFGLNASFSRTVILIVTFGCAAVKSSAIFCQSDLPGSLFWMCHQSIVTGSRTRLPTPAPKRRSTAAAPLTKPSRAAGLEPPPVQAAKAIDAVARRTANPSTGSHWPKPPLGTGRVTTRERALWAMTSPPMRSSVRPRSRPGRPTSAIPPRQGGGVWRGGIGGSLVRSSPILSTDNRSVAGLLLESCGAPVDSFGSATVGVAVRDLSMQCLRLGVAAGRDALAATFASKLSSHGQVRYTAAVTSPSQTAPRSVPDPTTMADIAEMTGVSVPTVSKVDQRAVGRLGRDAVAGSRPRSASTATSGRPGRAAGRRSSR